MRDAYVSRVNLLGDYLIDFTIFKYGSSIQCVGNCSLIIYLLYILYYLFDKHIVKLLVVLFFAFIIVFLIKSVIS